MTDEINIPKKHRTGVNCEFCGTSLVGVFAYTGFNTMPEKIQGFNYCKECREVFRVRMEKV